MIGKRSRSTRVDGPRLSEGELLAAIWNATDYKSAQTGRTLLSLAHDNHLLLRERQASIAVRIALGPGERPATLYVVSSSGGFDASWSGEWPRRFQDIATEYEAGLRRIFRQRRNVGRPTAAIGVIRLRDVTGEMASLRRLVARTVASIRKINAADAAELPDALLGLEGEARRRMILHRQREGWLRDARIALVMRDTGRLACEITACGFDFEAAYGQLGTDYAQVHHLLSLATRTAPAATRVADLRVVCANCHAMIHVGGKSRSLTSIGQALRASRKSRRPAAADDDR